MVELREMRSISVVLDGSKRSRRRTIRLETSLVHGVGYLDDPERGANPFALRPMVRGAPSLQKVVR